MVSYLIKSIICSGLLFIVYHFVLEREKMLRFNRFYLLLAMAFSLLAPLATIEMPSGIVEEVATDKLLNQPVVSAPLVNHEAPEVSAEKNTALPAYLPWLMYGSVAVALLLRTGFQILTILRSKSGRRIASFETANLVLMPGNAPTYTFFNFIFLSQKAFENQNIPKDILTHELAHAKQKHSLDILFTELLIALWWFNPLLLLYRRAIRLNHEYLADEAVLTGPTDVKEYQLMLLDTLLAQRTTALASSFNYPFTKKRLAMMTKHINRRIQFVKKALIALLLPVLALALAEKTYSQQPASKTTPNSAKKVDNVPVSGNGAVSEEEMKDFFATIEKYTRYAKNGKGRIDPIVEMTPAIENQLYAVHERMSDEQKKKVETKEIRLFRMEIPVKKSPAPEMFENWKRPDVFGIWLNGKHVRNSELNKYKNTDIAEYTLYRLVGAGLRGKGYKYQLELATNEHFDKTYEQRVEDRVVILRRGWVVPKEAPKKGK